MERPARRSGNSAKRVRLLSYPAAPIRPSAASPIPPSPSPAPDPRAMRVPITPACLVLVAPAPGLLLLPSTRDSRLPPHPIPSQLRQAYSAAKGEESEKGSLIKPSCGTAATAFPACVRARAHLRDASRASPQAFWPLVRAFLASLRLPTIINCTLHVIDWIFVNVSLLTSPAPNIFALVPPLTCCFASIPSNSSFHRSSFSLNLLSRRLLLATRQLIGVIIFSLLCSRISNKSIAASFFSNHLYTLFCLCTL
jgi:hypothetical protein